MTPLLVVDDDPDIARTLGDVLAHNGFGCRLAGSGEEALEMLAAAPADLILLDARLPGMSGFEACSAIRECYGPGLPVVMITAFGDRVAMARASEVGADDLLQKPLDTAALLLKVRSLLRLKALHDETRRSREQAQARVRDLALLHEIGRDWSLIAEPEEFHRMVTQRLAGLTGAPVCLMALFDPASGEIAAALPAHGLADEVAVRLRYRVELQHSGMWNFRSGRPYVSNRCREDPRMVRELVDYADLESVVLMPMTSEGTVLGVLVAGNKPGGFTDADVQLLSIFAGPAATFLRSRQIFDRQRRHAARLERLSDLMGAMAGSLTRNALLELAVSRLQRDLGYARVAFWGGEGASLRREALIAGDRHDERPAEPERLKWALRSAAPLENVAGSSTELTVPVRAGEQTLGVLDILRTDGQRFDEEELNLLSAVAGQLALALQKAASLAETERLARQMATLYDVGLETAALHDLQALFLKASEEAGRLIRADHTSVLRLDESQGLLRLFAAWARDPAREPYATPTFRVGEGIAGRVARDRVAAIVNEVEQHPGFVPRGNPVARLVSVPITYYDRQREAVVLFGVLSASRRPGTPAFTGEDLEYLTRFAGQLSIAAANSMAFAAERERSEQLALVNTLLREIAGQLARQPVLEKAVRRIHEAFRYPLVSIHAPRPEAGLHEVVAWAGRASRRETWGSLPLAGGGVARAFREQRTVLLGEPGSEAEGGWLLPEAASAVATPIVVAGEVSAVLSVESSEANAFKHDAVLMLETLADGIGIILRNAELYQALETTNARLVELDRLKSELVNIVAHDFRAPLSGVLGYGELLEWKPEAPVAERVDSARAIVRAATHMASLVDKTLKTSRLESGQFPFEFGIVDLADTVRGVLDRLPARPSHEVVAEIPEDPLPCWADRERLAEVVENLVHNAVKYSPTGGTIRLSVSREAESISLAVVDPGLGIAADDLGRLFRPFSRVRRPETSEIAGSGLGLYICDRIVRAHGGRLTVSSQPGHGSRFEFTLPLFGIAAQAPAPLLLIAAGDEGSRREARRTAEDLGFAVMEVADGVEAVESANRLRPAAIVVDRVLPRLRAVEVAERLSDRAAGAEVPLFLLGAAADVGPHAHRFAAFLGKPLDPLLLRAALETRAEAQRPVSR